MARSSPDVFNLQVPNKRSVKESENNKMKMKPWGNNESLTLRLQFFKPSKVIVLYKDNYW